MKHTKLNKILEVENDQLRKLNEIVHQAIEEEKLISQKLIEFEDNNPPFSSRLSDKVALFGGSWKFIISFASIMLIWIILNTSGLTNPFDPFPFILLNLVLSTIAALQAPLIMMSQNRKEDRDRQRSINDYLINLKSEIEVRNLHEKLDLLMKEQMQTVFEIQKTQLQLMQEIKTVLNGPNKR